MDLFQSPHQFHNGHCRGRCREYLGASKGIGYRIAQAEAVFDTTGMFAGMAVLALVLLLIVGTIVGRVERQLLRSKPLQDSVVLDGLHEQ